LLLDEEGELEDTTLEEDDEGGVDEETEDSAVKAEED
jgi:hypothetical protein